MEHMTRTHTKVYAPKELKWPGCSNDTDVIGWNEVMARVMLPKVMQVMRSPMAEASPKLYSDGHWLPWLGMLHLCKAAADEERAEAECDAYVEYCNEFGHYLWHDECAEDYKGFGERTAYEEGPPGLLNFFAPEGLAWQTVWPGMVDGAWHYGIPHRLTEAHNKMSQFVTLVQGCKEVQSAETQPGYEPNEKSEWVNVNGVVVATMYRYGDSEHFFLNKKAE